MHLEEVWNQAHVAGDAETLDRLWADDLEVAVPHMAVMTRAEALGFARSGRMKFLSYETSDLHIRVYGDAAVVTGHLLRTRTLNGNKVSDDWHFTKVYIRQAHQWRVVSFQASDSPARDLLSSPSLSQVYPELPAFRNIRGLDPTGVPSAAAPF
jgi:ketosteroid isomerase-like protein